MAPYKSHDLDDVIRRPMESMTEDDLLQLHFTHRKEMDGSSRLKQHDNVHQQIAALEKLLQHAINRFSTDKLYQMIHVVMYTLEYIPRHATQAYSDEIGSLEHLRLVLDEFRKPDRRGIEKDEQSHVVKYFDTFFEDISYLKSLKSYFDQKVYACLYDYFYDPEDDTLDPREALKREQKGKVTFKEDNDSGLSSQTDDETRYGRLIQDAQVEAELEFYYDRLSDGEKLSMAVRKLYVINLRWDQLLDGQSLDAQLFDPDSRHEILQYTDYERFENVFRLVPDLFVKAYKSVEMAKLWWTQANKIYEILPQKHSKKRSEQEINQRIEQLQRKLNNIRDEVKRHEELLEKQALELDDVRAREVRYKSLSEECEKLELQKNDMGDRYNAILGQRNELKVQLRQVSPYSLQYHELHQEATDWEKRFFDAQVELKMLTFQFQLIQSDFLLELELRPDLIRYQVDIEYKMEETRTAIWNKGEEARDSEKRLTLLKTNCERMRIIMRKILHGSEEAEASGREDGKRHTKKAGEERRVPNAEPRKNHLYPGKTDADTRRNKADTRRRDGPRNSQADSRVTFADKSHAEQSGYRETQRGRDTYRRELNDMSTRVEIVSPQPIADPRRTYRQEPRHTEPRVTKTFPRGTPRVEGTKRDPVQKTETDHRTTTEPSHDKPEHKPKKKSKDKSKDRSRDKSKDKLSERKLAQEGRGNMERYDEDRREPMYDEERYEDRSGWFEDKSKRKSDRTKPGKSHQYGSESRHHEPELYKHELQDEEASDTNGNDADTDSPTPRSRRHDKQSRQNGYQYTIPN